MISQVKDTVEVDHNVSRHLTDELYSSDWDLLVSLSFTRMTFVTIIFSPMNVLETRLEIRLILMYKVHYSHSLL